MSQTQTVGKHQTKISQHGENTYITYWSTDVVAFDNNWVKLETGGWFTNTTKLRMNQASNQYNLDFSVYQKNHQWYVVTPDGVTHKWNMDLPYFGFDRKGSSKYRTESIPNNCIDCNWPLIKS